MATNTNNPMGNFSGSIGGLNFWVVGSKQFVRKKAVPRNTNTLCQVGARSAMRNMAARFLALDYADKQAFNVFGANSYFSPKKNLYQPHNGYQAFLGTKIIATDLQAKLCPTIGFTDINPVPVTTVAFENKVQYSIDAYFSSSLYPLFGGGTSGVITDPIVIDASPSLTFGFHLDPAAQYVNSDELHDFNGMLSGFSFYLSNPLKFEGEKPKQFYRKHIGYTGAVKFPPGYLPLFNYVNFKLDLTDTVNKCRFNIRAGQWFYVTCFVFAPSGQGNFVSSEYIQVII